jgi:hypothetical protein
VNYELDLIWGRTEGAERALPDWEGLVESVRQGLVIRCIGSSGGVNVFGEEGKRPTVIDRC